MSEHHKQIKAYIQRFFPGHDLKPDEDIFALGFVNSMFIMQLVTFVEQEFSFSIDNDDLERENFTSINAIASLVERSLARKG